MKVIWMIILMFIVSINGSTHNTNATSGRNMHSDSSYVLPRSFVLDDREEMKEPFSDYKEKMGMLESSNNYHVVNRFGYMGKYQFGKKTLRGLVREGYLKTDSLENFLENVELQEKAMDALIQCNLDYIKRNKLDKYVGKTVGGVKVSLNGLLAGSHLVGPYAVKRFLKTDGRIIKKDGNGTSVKDYMREYENKKINSASNTSNRNRDRYVS